MYRCQVCKKTSAPYETQAIAVVQVKEYEFPERKGVYPAREDEETRDDPGGVGYQIAKEVRGHETCLKDLQCVVIEGSYRPEAEDYDPSDYTE